DGGLRRAAGRGARRYPGGGGTRRVERDRRARSRALAVRRRPRRARSRASAPARRVAMTRRVWLRAAALGLVLVGVIAGLTVYFSTESVPARGVSGGPTRHPPNAGRTHRYAVVVPGPAAYLSAL